MHNCNQLCERRVTVVVLYTSPSNDSHQTSDSNSKIKCATPNPPIIKLTSHACSSRIYYMHVPWKTMREKLMINHSVHCVRVCDVCAIKQSDRNVSTTTHIYTTFSTAAQCAHQRRATSTHQWNISSSSNYYRRMISWLLLLFSHNTIKWNMFYWGGWRLATGSKTLTSTYGSYSHGVKIDFCFVHHSPCVSCRCCYTYTLSIETMNEFDIFPLDRSAMSAINELYLFSHLSSSRISKVSSNPCRTMYDKAHFHMWEKYRWLNIGIKKNTSTQHKETKFRKKIQYNNK